MEYTYHVVQFIKKGRQGTRSIDIVPAKWTTYDQKTKKFKSSYMEPPYNDEDRQLIQTLMKENADAPEDWPLYNIKIVARARKFYNFLSFKKYLVFFILCDTVRIIAILPLQTSE